jgi:hypothetical protein
LRRAPRIDVEAAEPAAWLTADDASEEGWQPIELRPRVPARASGEPEEATVRAVDDAWGELDRASGGTWRISIRRTVPHLEIHVRPPLPTSPPSDRLVSAVRKLAQSLAGG